MGKFPGLLYSSILIGFIIYNYETISLLLSDLRVINTLFLDNGRIKLVGDFLSTVTESPSVLLHGYGIEKWTGEAGQEPHNVFLHMISDYGIFGSISYIALVFGYGFGLFKKSVAVRQFSLFLLLCTLPNFMLHTYALERGQLMLFMILSAYFLTSRLALNYRTKVA